MTKTERELDVDHFVIWISSFFSDAFIERVENRLFFRSDALSDEDQFSAICLERLQLPAAGDEIEKLRAIGQANEAFCRTTLGGRPFAKRAKQSREKALS